MEPNEVHPDLLGEALSHSGQRLAQLGSLLASWAMVEGRRAERRNHARAARSEAELRVLREQERAAYQLARAGWAPSLDRQWMASAGLVETARAWSAASAYAGADPSAAAAAGRCEERLRKLHPYAMTAYDRMRGEGAAPFDAMRDALPLFARAPHARPGGPARPRPALAATETPQAATATGRAPGGESAPDLSPRAAAGSGGAAAAARAAVVLAAESFPVGIADAVRTTAGIVQVPARTRPLTPYPLRRPGRPMLFNLV
jgi:hypothetical protein